MPQSSNSAATGAGATPAFAATSLSGDVPGNPVLSGDPSPSAPVALSPANPSVTTTAPSSSVSVSVPNAAGTVTFALVVTDSTGVESAPAYATVTIQGTPVAVLTATPPSVTVGGAIELSGAGSTSSGSIVSYKFSLVPAAV